MTTNHEIRMQAKIALQKYARNLEENGYNKECIEQSIMGAALEVAMEIERGIME